MLEFSEGIKGFSMGHGKLGNVELNEKVSS